MIRVVIEEDSGAALDERGNDTAVVGADVGVAGVLDGEDKVVSGEEAGLAVRVEDLRGLTGRGVVLDPAELDTL